MGTPMSAGQPCPDSGCSSERGRAKDKKCDSPVEPVGENSGAHPARKTAKSGSADIEAHNEGHAIGRPFFPYVSHDDGDDARDHDALQKAPKDELTERCGSGGKQRGNRDSQQRGDYHALAGHPLRQGSKNGRRKGDPERGRRDSHADPGFGRVKKTREQREQRLGAIELEKRADAAQRNRNRSPAGGVCPIRLGVRMQETG
jgi:hypothetical protein